MVISCPGCGKRLEVQDSAIGRQGRCPSCKHLFTLTAPGGTPPPVPPPRVPPPPVSPPPFAPPPVLAASVPPPRVPTVPVYSYDPVDDEASRRRRNAVIIGAVLLAAFFCPVYVTKLVFPNIELLGEERAPAVAKFVFLFPLIAGIVAIVMGLATDGRARGGVLLGLFGVFWIVLLSSEGASEGLKEMLRGMGGGTVAAFVLSMLGWLGIICGARSRWYRPASIAALVAGIAGGVFYLITLVLPLYPSRMGTVALVVPFKMLKAKEMAPMAIGSLVQMGCMIAAAILCFVNYSLGSTAKGRRLAGLAFALVIWGIVAGLAGIVWGMFAAMGEHVKGEMVAAALSVLVKGVLWGGGMMALLPAGVIDLIIGPPAPARPVPPGVPLPLPFQDHKARLEKLQGLLNAGLITQAEYDQKKAQILSQM